jgi:thiol-disulfide isomerase/thioredoxin
MPKRLVAVLVTLAVVAALPALGASAKEQVKDLEARLEMIEKNLDERLARLEQTLSQLEGVEKRLAALESKIGQLEAAGGRTAPAQPTAQDEQAAQQLYNQVNDLVTEGDYEAARAKLGELQEKYPRTRYGRGAARLAGELAVVGKEAPEDFALEQWFQGESDVDLDSGKPTLLVFWELWCPHCRREVPKLQQAWETYKDKGLQVVGVTKLSRNTTPEQLEQFLDEQKVSYPVAKESGELSRYFAVRGVPAAAVIKDGKVVWRGHPVRLSDEMIEGWL